MKQLPGGICAAKGFRAAATHAGVKAGSSPDKNDLALIFSEAECNAAGMFTTNRVKAAPVYVTMAHLESGVLRGVVVNSGNANACCHLSHEHAEEVCAAAAQVLGVSPDDIAVGSTGVIGQELNAQAIIDALPGLAQNLTKDGSDAAAHAIMTTDTKKKEIAVSFEVGGKTVTLGGIAKGSGMIHPAMGTMLCYLTTDCAISTEMLGDALHQVVPRTFNRVTVDGDTSTNDTCLLMANGLAGNPLIEWKDEGYDAFVEALTEVCTYLAKHMAADGEGASRLITCTVSGSRSEDAAERLSKSIVSSSLVKAAVFGADANWGRVVCAMGYSRAPFRPECVEVRFASAAGEIQVCYEGMQVLFDEDKAKAILSQPEVEILVDVHEGHASATCWGCDLTYEYVHINGDYRT
ncbi:MAG: bifunctional glutamate N-acetyltransferase/amino-acid acetyltransferase ArgJ [Clostridiales bacterium]|nr:bifunctional glutamate N-acetyltransferase/amino-acid acetyltransferase ArgJ [Clostridiales bacterium]